MRKKNRKKKLIISLNHKKGGRSYPFTIIFQKNKVFCRFFEKGRSYPQTIKREVDHILKPSQGMVKKKASFCRKKPPPKIGRSYP